MEMTAAKPLPDDRAAAAWVKALPLALALAVLLWQFRETAQAMVAIWSRSDTFAHAFLVPPISLWLAWRRRAQLQAAPVAPSMPWLLAVVAACGAWQLAQLAGVHAAAQAALVAMIVFAVPAVLGTRLARIVAFPLAFLFFAVPVGEFLIEPMMERTADFTVAALRFTGIPVYREGLQFVIPSGNWSVVAACSGVRYLIASLMVGTLFAYLNFHSTQRRLAFMAFAVAVPVVANWLRAYLIVMLGHLSDNKLAASADHLVYGWVFFGVVILLMFMVGSRFVDAPPAAGAGVGAPAPARRAGGPWLAALGLAAAFFATQQVHHQLAGVRAGPLATAPLPAQWGGWQVLAEPFTTWAPAYRNAAAVVAAQYRSRDGGADDVVGVWAGLYRDQGYDRKMITSTNVLVEEGSLAWLPLARPAEHVDVGGDVVELRATLLRAPADPKLTPNQRLLAWRVYHVNGRFVAGDAQAMLWLGWQRLLGRGDDTAVLMFYTPAGDDARGRERLAGFVREHLPELGARIQAAGSAPGPAAQAAGGAAARGR
ncbi:MAG: exosortase A [Rubrivivax sp.]|nr:exosortase A [Rubrivivax sp.]